MNRFKEKLQISNNLDKYLAILGAIFSAILILYLLITTGRPLAGILSFISCTIWLFIRNKTSLDYKLLELHSINLTLTSIFFLLVTLSVLSIYFRPDLYERPLLYFIIISLIAGIIGLEILFSKENLKCLILFQIVILGISIAWSQLLIFPGLVGVDPWWHQMFTYKIIESSHIPENYSYSKLPIFHLLIVTTSLITVLSYKFATMMSISLVQIICNAIFVFLLGKYLFNYKIGLLASLMVIIANHHIYMSYWSIPNALAAIFIPIVLYLLFKIKKEKTLHALALSIFFMGTLILTHTISAMCMAIILFVLWFAFILFNIIYSNFNIIYSKINNPISLTISIFFIIAMFTWWNYASGSLNTFANLIKWGFSIDIFVHAPNKVLNYVTTVPFFEQIFYSLGIFLFFSLSFIGIFYMVSKKGNSFSFSITLAGFTPLALNFFSVITGHSIIEHRWWYFSQILLAIPMAIAIILISNWKGKNSKFKFIFSFLFVMVLTFLMIMSTPANTDNRIFSPNIGIRYAYTESEMNVASFFARTSVNTIFTDFYYGLAFSNQYSNVSVLSLDESLYNKNFKHDETIKIIRKEIISRPFGLYGVLYCLDYDPNEILCSSGFNKIYDSSMVDAYK